MKRRSFLAGLIHLPLFTLVSSSSRAWSTLRKMGKPTDRAVTPSRIAFGSCAIQDIAQPIWNKIGEAKPDLFAFIGDNIYADTEDMVEMQAKYDQLAAIPEYVKFRENFPVLAIWDDHDFGVNDGGSEYPMKAESKELFMKFFNEPAISERRGRDGLYTSYFYGEHPNVLQIIMMDLRWWRTPLVGTPEGGYIPNPDPQATMLGPVQWQWMEEQLRMPADFRILVSTTQFIAPNHQWEKWANFPFEKARMLKLIDDLNIKNIVVISGDMHYGELSLEKTPGGLDLYEMTSSGINQNESSNGIPNANRVEVFDTDSNFGLINVDWNSEPMNVSLTLRDSTGAVVIEKQLTFDRAPAMV